MHSATTYNAFSRYLVFENIFLNQLMNSCRHARHSSVPFTGLAPKPCPPVLYWIYLWGIPFAVSAESSNSEL